VIFCTDLHFRADAWQKRRKMRISPSPSSNESSRSARLLSFFSLKFWIEKLLTLRGKIAFLTDSAHRQRRVGERNEIDGSRGIKQWLSNAPSCNQPN
jgi:hypothetical protein